MLRRMIEERGLLSSEELASIGSGSGWLFLAGRLVELGRVRPEELQALRREAESRAAAQDSSRGEAPPLTSTVKDPQILPLPDGTGRRVVGRFELIEQLGRGGMGVVFRARAIDRQDPRQYAVKFLLEGEQPDARRRKRFEEELRLLLRLDHPNLVRVRDCGLHAGRHPYIVMDLIEGRSLRTLLRQRALGAQEAVRLVSTLARALATAHGRGVIHRDIKPENVRVDAELRPTLIDFGLGLDEERLERLTRTGTVLGTPDYMPPELAAGKTHSVDARADVWGLGALLYELLAGAPPYHAPTWAEHLRKLVSGPPPSLARLRPDLSPALVEAVERALAVRPQDRWPSATALAVALDQAIEPPLSRRSRVLGLVVALLACAALVGLGLLVLPLVTGPRLPS